MPASLRKRHPVAISKEEVFIGDFAEEAQELRKTYGLTDKFTTGHAVLDRYLHGDENKYNNYRGGFGRKNGYEIMLLYGPTGIGKSTVALNFLAPAITRGVKVGLLILEDDMADASVRLSFILTEREYATMNSEQNVRCLPKGALVKRWKLADLLEYIEDWFVNQGVEIILLDHLQFAFEGAESVKGENEWASQRVFMQALNEVVKRLKKTIILVSHINKGMGKGMDKVQGSGALAQAGTKVIEVTKDEDSGDTVIRMRKSRFTPTPNFGYHMKLNGSKLERIV